MGRLWRRRDQRGEGESARPPSAYELLTALLALVERVEERMSNVEQITTDAAAILAAVQQLIPAVQALVETDTQLRAMLAQSAQNNGMISNADLNAPASELHEALTGLQASLAALGQAPSAPAVPDPTSGTPAAGTTGAATEGAATEGTGTGAEASGSGTSGTSGSGTSSPAADGATSSAPSASTSTASPDAGSATAGTATGTPPPVEAGAGSATPSDATAPATAPSSAPSSPPSAPPEGRTVYTANGDVVPADAGDATQWSPAGLLTAEGGHPLYYFAGDTAPGDAHGDGAGGVWFRYTGATVEAPPPPSTEPAPPPA